MRTTLHPLFSLLFLSLPAVRLLAQTDYSRRADSCAYLALDRYDQKQYAEALMLTDSAFAWYRRSGEPPTPLLYANRGAILFSIGDYLEALRQFRAGLAAAEKFEDRWSEALLYANLGNTYQKLKKYTDSVLALMKAGDLYQTLQAREEYATTLYQLSECYLEAGQPVEAARYAALLDKVAGPGEQWFVQLARGKLALGQGAFPEAAQALRQAYALAHAAGSADWAQYATLLLLECYVGYEQERRKNPALAALFTPEEERALIQKTGELENYPDPKQRLILYRVASQLHKNQGDPHLALVRMEQFITLNDSLVGKEQLDNINRLETEYKTRDKQRQIDLLEKEKLLAALTLRQRNQSLTLARIEAGQRAQQLRILEQQRELDTCALQNANFALENATILNRRNNAEIEILSRDNALHQAAISRQRLWLALLLALGALGAGGGWMFYRRLHERRLDTLRNRLSRDLHDDLGSALGAIALNGALAAQAADPERMRQALTHISEEARGTGARVRDLVWALHPGADTLDETLARMRRFAAGLLEDAGAELRFDTAPNTEALRLDQETRRHFYLFFKEVVHNIAKHAGANQVQVDIRLERKRLHLVVQDDGRGFEPAAVRRGNGLNNLAARAELLGGKYRLDTRPGQGTRVELVFAVRR